MYLMKVSLDALWPKIFISKCTLDFFTMHYLALISSIIKDIIANLFVQGWACIWQSLFINHHLSENPVAAESSCNSHNGKRSTINLYLDCLFPVFNLLFYVK